MHVPSTRMIGLTAIVVASFVISNSAGAQIMPQPNAVTPPHGRVRTFLSHIVSPFRHHAANNDASGSKPGLKSRIKKIRHKIGTLKPRNKQHKNKRRKLLLEGAVQKNSYVSANEAKLSTALVKCSSDADVVIHSSRLVSIQSGDVLVSAKQPVVIQTSGTSVCLNKGCIVLASNRNGIVKIRNLCESRLNSAKAIVDGTSFPIRAGQEVVLANSFDAAEQSMQLDKVNRRAPNTFELPSGRQLVSCEFEPITVIKQSELLCPMRHSRDRDEKKLFNSVLKMAACLQYATASHGKYLPCG